MSQSVESCRVLTQPRSMQRYEPMPAEYEQVITDDIVELASRYGRYGYRRITALLRHRGWRVNHKRVERIWRREGLKVPSKQPGRARLWLLTGRASGSGPRDRTTSGPTTSSWSGQETVELLGC
jgi:transposase InsO family protein